MGPSVCAGRCARLGSTRPADAPNQYQYVFALDAGHCERKVREQTLSEALQWVCRGYRPAQ